MLLVPNHHVIVPRTEDMAFRMPNKITKLGAQRNALEHEVFLNNASVVNLPFNPRSVYWAEVYINGIRVVNLQYPTTHTRGIPHEQFKVTSNTVVFGSNITGLVKVIVDQDSQPLPETTTDPALKGLIIDVDNFQSFDIYEQRFTPARWASNSSIVAGAGPYGITNSQIRHRFSDSFYTEPMVITQPHCGYVRPTSDRKNLLYVPAFNFQGYDCFTYTFLTQHGQVGEAKTIHIEVFGPPENMTHAVSANVAVVVEGGYAKFQLLTNGVCPGEQLPFKVAGTATTGKYRWLNDYTNGGGYVNSSHEFGVFIIDEDTTRTGIMPGRATIEIETFLDNDYTPATSNVYIELLCDAAANAEVEIIGATLSLTANVPWMIPGQCVEFTARLNSPKIVPLTLNYEIVEELYDIETLTSTTSTFMNGTFNLVLNTSNTVYCTTISCPPSNPNSQLLTDILKTSVINGSFETGLTGWDIYTPGQDDVDLIVKLGGNSIIAGWPTPVSSFAGRSTQAKKITVFQSLFEAKFNADDKTDGSQSLSLFSYGRVTYSGYLRGPIAVSQNLYRLPVGSVFQFDYRGIAIDDYYDAVVYLLNPLTGNSLMLLDKFGPTDSAFVTVSKTITSADVGIYRLVICGGGHDNTNGGLIGSELLIDNIKITGATGVYPCNPIKRMITARLLDDYTIKASTQVVNLDGFNLTVAQNTVFEGETISFNLHNYDFCSNILVNSKIPYGVTYKDLTLYNSDFVNNVFPLSGNFIMSSFDANGYVSAAITYNTFDDFIPLERPETFYISPFDCPTIGNSVTIYDSCPSIIAVPHTSSILEGDTVNFFYRIRDLNTPYRTRNLSWEIITDGTLSASDFTTPLTGNIEGNLEASNPLTGVLSCSTANRSSLNLPNFDNFYIKFYTNQVTKATCYVTPQVQLIQVPPPTPTPTPTPKPSKTPAPTIGGGTSTPAPTPGASCSINTSISGGGTIKVKGPCPGDNTIVTIIVTLSRAITTVAPKSGSRSWGSCNPPYKSIKVSDSIMVTGSFSPMLVTYGSTVSAPFILLGQESLNASGTSWKLYYTAQTTTPAGAYKVTLLDGTGMAVVPGQCQNNKAITGPTGYVTFTVIR